MSAVHPEMPDPLQQAPRRRFSAGTVLIPAVFIILHFIMVSLASILFLIGTIIAQGISDQTILYNMLTDADLLNRLLLENYPVICVIYGAGLIPVYLAYLLLRQRRDRRTILLGPLKGPAALAGAAIMAGLLGVTNLWIGVLDKMGDSVPAIENALENYEEMAGSFSPASGYLWLVLGVCIAAPLTEELLFRGIIQGELRKAMPEWAAIVIQALIFALYHMQPVQISYVILPGLLLGFAYYWTRSIWVPVFMHAFFNFMGSVLPALLMDNELYGNILGWVEIGFILVGALAAAYLYMKHRSDRRVPAGAAL